MIFKLFLVLLLIVYPCIFAKNADVNFPKSTSSRLDEHASTGLLKRLKNYTRINFSKNIIDPNSRNHGKDRLYRSDQSDKFRDKTIAKIPQPSSLQTINILMLLFYGTLGAVMPYLPIYYRFLGVSDAQIGILGAISPAITFLVSPLWGALADTTGKHKEIMLLTFVGSILSRSLLMISNKSMISLSLIISLSALLFAPVKPLIDSAVMNVLTNKSDYGRSRLYGQVGFGLGSFIVGPLINNKESRYGQSIQLMFIIQCLLAIPVILIMSNFEMKKIILTETITLKKKTSFLYKLLSKINPRVGDANTTENPDDPLTNGKTDLVSTLRALRHLLRDLHVFMFFVIVFVIGVSSGIIENFAYVRISEVTTAAIQQQGDSSSGGSSNNVLGWCRLLSSLAGGPMFWLSGSVVKKVGIDGVLALSLISYILRFFIYASISNPWHALPAELLRGVTFAMFWSASTFYVYNISPKNLTATMLGLLNGIYGGIGQSSGSLIGGYLSRKMSISQTFKYCAAFEVVLTVIFGIYQAIQYSLQLSQKAKLAALKMDTPPQRSWLQWLTAPLTRRRRSSSQVSGSGVDANVDIGNRKDSSKTDSGLNNESSNSNASSNNSNNSNASGNSSSEEGEVKKD